MRFDNWHDWQKNILTDADFEAYKSDSINYSNAPFRLKTKPTNSWALPYATGHTYKIHWRQGLDFEKMQLDLSNRWKDTDKNLHLVLNFTDVRAHIHVDPNGVEAKRILNETLDPTTALTSTAYKTGDNILYNRTHSRYYKQFHFIVNGKDMVNRTRLNFIG